MARRRFSSGHSRMGRPSMKSWPLGDSQRRAMREASVVLPLPVGPTIASVEPAGIFRLMSRKTGWAVLAPAPFVLPALAEAAATAGAFAPLPARFVGYVNVRSRNSISPLTLVSFEIVAALSS